MMPFLPEVSLLGAGLVIFFVCIGGKDGNTVKNIAITLGALILATSLLAFNQRQELFFNTYRVDLFSQTFKVLIAAALFAVLLLGKRLDGLRQEGAEVVLADAGYDEAREFADAQGLRFPMGDER